MCPFLHEKSTKHWNNDSFTLTTMPPRIHPDISEEDHTKRTRRGAYSDAKMLLFSVQPIYPTLELEIEEEADHTDDEE